MDLRCLASPQLIISSPSVGSHQCAVVSTRSSIWTVRRRQCSHRVLCGECPYLEAFSRRCWTEFPGQLRCARERHLYIERPLAVRSFCSVDQPSGDALLRYLDFATRKST